MIYALFKRTASEDPVGFCVAVPDTSELSRKEAIAFVHRRYGENNFRITGFPFEFKGFSEFPEKQERGEAIGYKVKGVCDICGSNLGAQIEPRFNYITCNLHTNIPPVFRDQARKDYLAGGTKGTYK